MGEGYSKIREITILAFNIGYAGEVVNGPGMCLYNFCNMMSNYKYTYKLNVFTKLPSKGVFGISTHVSSMNDVKGLSRAIQRSDVVHMWSGLGSNFERVLDFALNLGKKVIIGPNVLDGYKKEKEIHLLKNKEADRYLFVNKKLMYNVSKLHKIDINKSKVFQVGPDSKLWFQQITQNKNLKNNGKILWKGNSKQSLKGLELAKDIEKLLPQYKFDYIGYPKPYDYLSHIEKAKKYKLYICTSISETMSLAMAEQWMAGVPSISHPQIYIGGENYKTGIITHRTPEDYAEAIVEVMENPDLHRGMAVGAQWEALRRFDNDLIARNYRNIVESMFNE